MKICTRCKCEKEISEFHVRKATGKPYAYCKGCHRAYTKAHYEANKADYIKRVTIRNKKIMTDNRVRMAEYLRSNPCVDCGETDLRCLDFDHRDNKLKSRDVTRMLAWSWDTIMNEIEKCDIRCANCHRKRTAEQFGYWSALGV